MKIAVTIFVAGLLSLAMLAGCGQEASTEDAASAAPVETEASAVAGADTESETGEGVYKIYVSNALGYPVPGVKVQFCSADECLFGTTDSDGYAEFNQPEGQSYEAHVLSAPKGYAKDETVYPVPDKYATVEIELHVEGGLDAVAENAENANVMDLSEAGAKFDGKGAYADTKGSLISVYGESFLESEPSVWSFKMMYYAYPWSELSGVIEYIEDCVDASSEGKPLPEAPEKNWEKWSESIGELFHVFAIDSGKGRKELKPYVEDTLGTDEFKLEKIKKLGDLTYFIVQDPRETTGKISIYKKNMEPEYFKEYKKLLGSRQDFMDSLIFVMPVYPVNYNIGDTIKFETKDVNGESVKSADLFKKAKVTMINVWSTTCHACIEEMPEVESIGKEYSEKGGQIILVCAFANTPKEIESVKQKLDNLGCTLPCMASFEAMEKVFPSTSLPTTYFVDSEGKLLEEPIDEPNPTLYRECFDKHLRE
ncbi:MAG: redoxin domain-containing protein [Eubacterium sp.]|nr:redoxin domain-containing protein [Eubacterium sp.]